MGRELMGTVRAGLGGGDEWKRRSGDSDVPGQLLQVTQWHPRLM